MLLCTGLHVIAAYLNMGGCRSHRHTKGQKGFLVYKFVQVHDGSDNLRNCSPRRLNTTDNSQKCQDDF